MRAALVLAVLACLAGPASAEEAILMDPTPEDIELILHTYPLDQVFIQPGCAEYGTDRAKPGCYQAEKLVVAKFGEASFWVTLRRCLKPDVDCDALVFEMWRRQREPDPTFVEKANEWNRSRWMVKVYGGSNWARVMMHVPVKGGIPQAALEDYVRIWYAAATEAVTRFPSY